MNYTDEFQRFWKAFPSRWNRNYGYVKRKKVPAFKAWQKLSQDIRDKCLRIVKQIKRSEGEAVRDCVTWLNQEGWEDIDEPEEVQHLPEQFTTDVFKEVHKPIDLNERRNIERRKIL